MAIKFSIVIAVKNEEKVISQLLLSLNNLNYDKCNYEVIFVDDNSTDQTYNLIFQQTEKNKNYKILKTKIDDHLEGKKAALSVGISEASFPYIITTDADCVLKSNWLLAFSEKFEKGYDVLFGISPFITNNTILNGIISFENFRNSMLSFALADMGLPYNAFGRNFAFRKEIFQKLNGYNNINKTLSGDDDLFLLLAVKNKFKIGTVKSQGSFVYSKPKETLKQFLSQRSRHTKTSAHYPKKIQAILAFWHLLNISSIISVLFALVNIYYFLPIAIKLLLDSIVTVKYQTKYGYKFESSKIFFYQICYEMLLIVHFINSKISKDKW